MDHYFFQICMYVKLGFSFACESIFIHDDKNLPDWDFMDLEKLEMNSFVAIPSFQRVPSYWLVLCIYDITTYNTTSIKCDKFSTRSVY